MATRIATSLQSGSPQAVAHALVADCHKQLEGVAPALALVFASTQQPLDQLMPTLHRLLPGTTLLGASTAGEFTEKGDAKGAVSMFAVAGDFKAHAGLGKALGSDAQLAVEEAVREQPTEVAGYPHRTVLMLVDPLSGKGEEAVLLAAIRLGEGVRLAGGAAGDDLKMSATQVAAGDRVASDAVVIATLFSKAPLGVGVFHGHRSISEPLKVTRASGNVVFEIGGRPAWDVWVDKTRAAAAVRGEDPTKLSDGEVGAYLLRHEAGLATGGSLKVRAPLSRGTDGSLSFACGIPEGAELQITESDPQRQVDSAREAARRASAQIGGAKIAGALVFDCICRNLILGNRFSDAVKTISDELGNVPLAGFETYGEIALDAGELSGFHNTTTVVLAFPC